MVLRGLRGLPWLRGGRDVRADQSAAPKQGQVGLDDLARRVFMMRKMADHDMAGSEVARMAVSDQGLVKGRAPR